MSSITVKELIEALKHCPPSATVTGLGENDEFAIHLVSLGIKGLFKDRVFLVHDREEFSNVNDKVLWQVEPEGEF